MNQKLAPVALFGYNRADHLQQTVEHLLANDLADATDVYFFSDGPRDSAAESGVAAVRRYGRSVSGFHSMTVIERPHNMGLRASMIDGVSSVAEKHGRVVVVEDDILASPGFLRYMNDALEFYENYHSVGSISGYMPHEVTRAASLSPQQTVFHYRPNCWGWATWWSRWGKADWEPSDWRRHVTSARRRKLLARGGTDMIVMLRCSMEGMNQSWMARWYFNCYLHGMLTLWPGASLVTNIGFDGSGVHVRKNVPSSRFDRYRCDIAVAAGGGFLFEVPVAVDDRVHRAMQRFWNLPWYADSAFTRPLRPIYRRLRTLIRK